MGLALPTSAWERLGQSVTIATVIGFITQGFGFSVRASALTSLISFLITLGFFYLLKKDQETASRLSTSHISPSLVVAVGLGAMLTGALFRQHLIDTQKIADIGEISDSLRWRIRFCLGRQQCITDALIELPSKVEARSGDPSEKLFADQALGEIIRTSTAANDLLRHSYGLYSDRFLGTGQSLPSNSGNFTAERIPEYLVPNYRDDHVNVLAWRMKPGDPLLDGKLGDLLEHDPMNSKPNSNQDRQLIKKRLINSTTPSVVRFAMVPDLERGGQNPNYSGCFGLPDRRRVFFSNLDYMMKNTASVMDASELSGYKFVTGKDKETQYLYVFMFAPVSPDECLEPTWKNLLVHLNETSICSQQQK